MTNARHNDATDINNIDKHSDAVLRQQLRQSLAQPTPGSEHPHEALQARVLAQWQQRHPATAQALASAGGPALAGGHANHRLRWVLALSLLVAVMLAAGWANRPDPVMEELMQPDVLSQIGLGEL